LFLVAALWDGISLDLLTKRDSRLILNFETNWKTSLSWHVFPACTRLTVDFVLGKGLGLGTVYPH
jgi:hypothetical protein